MNQWPPLVQDSHLSHIMQVLVRHLSVKFALLAKKAKKETMKFRDGLELLKAKMDGIGQEREAA